jgi:hypothetical protein
MIWSASIRTPGLSPMSANRPKHVGAGRYHQPRSDASSAADIEYDKCTGADVDTGRISRTHAATTEHPIPLIGLAGPSRPAAPTDDSGRGVRVDVQRSALAPNVQPRCPRTPGPDCGITPGPGQYSAPGGTGGEGPAGASRAPIALAEPASSVTGGAEDPAMRDETNTETMWGP